MYKYKEIVIYTMPQYFGFESYFDEIQIILRETLILQQLVGTINNNGCTKYIFFARMRRFLLTLGRLIFYS